MALTFDADMTDAMRNQLRSGAVRSYANLKIIDLLERERVPATFFLTGKWVEQYPDATRRLAGNPRFELANHTYGHLAFTPDCYGLPRIAEREMTADVARTFDVVAAYGGGRPGTSASPACATTEGAGRAGTVGGDGGGRRRGQR